MAKGYSSQQKSPRKSPWNQGAHAGLTLTLHKI